MAKLLEGKRAVVTGGSRGIGRGIVEAFAAEGATVLTCGRGGDGGDLPEGVHWLTADVSQGAEVERLADKAVELFGSVDILVNNAGIQIEKTVTDSSDDDWDLLMGVNAKAVFLMCRRFIPVMAGAGGGAIVNIGSISGYQADPAMALYNASKGFVHALTRSVAVDHGHQKIRCNAICPGWIATEMADQAFAGAKDPKAAEDDALARHAMGRLGRPADVAAMAVWLASDRSAFVTGQMHIVDGGLTAASPINPALF